MTRTTAMGTKVMSYEAKSILMHIFIRNKLFIYYDTTGANKIVP